jgi:two-component system, NtrC family, sensor histidine kinase KinB
MICQEGLTQKGFFFSPDCTRTSTNVGKSPVSLRVKLLLGYTVFIAALVLLGGWSAWHIRAMGKVSQRILADNYESVIMAQDMKESLERQDSAALFALLGEHERASTQLHEHRQRFNEAFRRAANNITEPGEPEVIEAIRRERDAYYALFDTFLTEVGRLSGDAGVDVAAPAAIARRNSTYFTRLAPAFDRLRAHCDRLLHLNQGAMLVKAEAAAGVAQRWFLMTLAVAGALVIAGLGLAISLAGTMVRPVHALTAATARIASGDFDAQAEVLSHDEIGLLATEFNRMAEHIRHLRRSDLGKLLVAQQTTEAIIDSLYDPVLVTDAQGGVTKLNPAAEQIFGPEGQNMGKPVAEIAHDSQIAMAVSETLRSQRPVAGEGSTPMRDEEGRLLGAVTLLEDITRLREIDRLKSEFIATASHELRTPLTSVQMGIHLLLESTVGPLTDAQREVLTICREDCERLEKLMHDLLDLSRIEAGEAAPNFVPISATTLIQAAVAAAQPHLEGQERTLRVEVPAGLPCVLADRLQIERVLSNLMSNAVRHTTQGDAITVTVTPHEGYVAVAVSDTGNGIPPEYLPRIFEKFVQGPNAPSGGAGLGLAISKHLIEAHGGQISVRSEVGRGTTFTLTLPMAGVAPGPD